jgi:hypothetical protein
MSHETTEMMRYAPFAESRVEDGADALRAAMDARGYLFFRALVPAEDILAVRRDILNLCAEADWLDPAMPLMDGVANPAMEPTKEGQAEYNAVYRRILKQLPRFHDLPEHPALRGVAAALLGSDDVLVHPRRIGRVTFPNKLEATTPAHQDHFYIRGTVDTFSCWVPLGACPIPLGGLAVLEGSHRQGFLEHTERFPAAVGGRGVPTDEGDPAWRASDFGLGDALFFHAYTIHKALPNRTPDRLRLSTDNRYQRRGDDIDPGALQTHLGL